MLNKIKSALEKLLKKSTATAAKNEAAKNTTGASTSAAGAKKGKEADKKKEGKDIYPMW